MKILFILFIFVTKINANDFYNLEMSLLNGKKISSIIIDEKGKNGSSQSSIELEGLYKIVYDISVEKDVKNSICLKQKVIFFIGEKKLSILVSKKSIEIGNHKHIVLTDLQLNKQTEEWDFISQEVNIKLRKLNSSGEVIR